LINIFYFI